jgi:hypothetical protein
VGAETKIKGLTRRSRIQSHLKQSAAIAVWSSRNQPIDQPDRSPQVVPFIGRAFDRTPTPDAGNPRSGFWATTVAVPFYRPKRQEYARNTIQEAEQSAADC